MEQTLVYLRVSSKGQEDNYSLDAQEKLALSYAQRNNFQIVKIWRGSESAWGKKERRNFMQMLEYAKKHNEIKHIIFDILDRMTRNDNDKIKIKELITKYGKLIHFSRSNKIYSIESNPDDEFMLDIETAVAKKYSNDISRKVKMGLTEKAEQGYYPSNSPLGYINNKNTNLIEIDPVNAPLIIKLFEKVATGRYSLFMLEQILYDKGLRHKTRGNRIPKSTLHRILHNPIYYGAFKWRGKLYSNAKHQPLISKELWDKAQETLASIHRPCIAKKDFAYRGLLVCGKCDCTVVGQNAKRQYVYYRCSFSKGQHKHSGYIREERMPDLFLPVIKAISMPESVSSWIEEGIQEISKQQGNIKTNKKEVLQKEYDRASKKLSNLYDLQLEGKIHSDMFYIKEQELSQELATLKSELTYCEVNSQEVYQKAHKTLEIVNNLELRYKQANNHEKAHILRLLGVNYVLDGKNVKATYRLPFNHLANIKETIDDTEIKKPQNLLRNQDFEDFNGLKSSKHLLIRGRRDLNPRSLP